MWLQVAALLVLLRAHCGEELAAYLTGAAGPAGALAGALAGGSA